MKIDDASLKELLRAAGRSGAPPPHALPDLADRVHQLRTRRRRALGGLLTTAVLLAGTTWAAYHAIGPTPTANNPTVRRPEPARRVQTPSADDEDVARLRAEIAALAAEARWRKEVVKEITQRERLREQLARLANVFNEPDPLEVARIEIEKTAFLLVDHADQQARVLPEGSAADEYRRIAEQFPNTNAARTARGKLSKLLIEKGEL